LLLIRWIVPKPTPDAEATFLSVPSVGRFERARYPLIRDAQDRRRLLEWLRRSEDRAVLDGDTAMISAMGRLRDRLKDVNGLARSSVGYGVSRCGGPVGGSV
jgi:hypothetical protein